MALRSGLKALARVVLNSIGSNNVYLVTIIGKKMLDWRVINNYYQTEDRLIDSNQFIVKTPDNVIVSHTWQAIGTGICEVLYPEKTPKKLESYEDVKRELAVLRAKLGFKIVFRGESDKKNVAKPEEHPYIIEYEGMFVSITPKQYQTLDKAMAFEFLAQLGVRIKLHKATLSVWRPVKNDD